LLEDVQIIETFLLLSFRIGDRSFRVILGSETIEVLDIMDIDLWITLPTTEVLLLLTLVLMFKLYPLYRPILVVVGKDRAFPIKCTLLITKEVLIPLLTTALVVIPKAYPLVKEIVLVDTVDSEVSTIIPGPLAKYTIDSATLLSLVLILST
jgi:hypothetical protein